MQGMNMKRNAIPQNADSPLVGGLAGAKNMAKCRGIALNAKQSGFLRGPNPNPNQSLLANIQILFQRRFYRSILVLNVTPRF